MASMIWLSLFENKAIPTWLLTLGIIAQLTFTLRFVYQWITSEKNKSSQLPIGFWRMSVVGAAINFELCNYKRRPRIIYRSLRRVGNIHPKYLYLEKTTL